ncbi:Dynamin central region family protein [Trichomonas vaginalis G3]|uniref:Dynamin central region family protein n=1 Tax=Trichomonas vaginalis (strain ATCC PRA-98 / G3) TaxID=412133 RepID=A2E540_TRIV3|nr:dynamin family [Trichomonas vaginalis G3]EAY12248.1 Dynamin central region family protein [Trichomonas vaginalis G3]KAI5536034.1 dynamin family [Trichomonas vaginalis G3]|eukprot:XP_001324471.1 Dynamin central region family protein [Trichomonas vaginalis G3]
MEDLIPIINSLQDVFAAVGSDVISLPQIAVVGSQSSGKSSVLESIVGRDFLPRGSGIVTRRPLILQLVHLDKVPQKGDPQEYGEFAHKPGKIFTDFQKINDEIIAETDRVTGTGRNVSKEPIRLKLWSPNVLNLTLVDLPGLTKNAVEGQPKSIVQEIYDMVKEFVDKPECLILAVSPANSDLANSDALRLARDVDPKGDRTVGVITKIDLMDAGTDCRDVLENRVYPLKLGYIGVVNRSQAAINSKVSMEKARQAEREFFENHRDYSDLADKCGTKYLTTILNRLLMEHIRTTMPALRHKIQTMLEEKERELEGYGSDPTKNAATINAFILDVISKYLDIFNNFLAGKRADGSESTDESTAHGGRIPALFTDKFNAELDALPGLTNSKPKQIYNMIKNHTGISVPIFTPDYAYDDLVKQIIEQFREPSLNLIDDVVKILFEMHSEVKFMELDRFNVLEGSIRAVVDDCIRECVVPCKQFINDLIDSERSFINSKRPDFRGPERIYAGKAKDLRARPLPPRPPVLDPVAVSTLFGSSKNYTQHQGQELQELQASAQEYFEIIREQLKDIIPKTVIRLVVQKSTENLRPKMIRDVFNAADSLQLMQEDPSITKKRISCTQIVEALRRAQQILLEVRTAKF